MSFRCNECLDNMNSGDVVRHLKECIVRKSCCKHPADRRITNSTAGFVCYEGCLDCNMWFGKPIALRSGQICSCWLCRK